MDAETKRKIAALEAKIALLEGREPAKGWKANVARYDKEVARELFENCPRTFYAQIAGKQLKLLQDQAEKYGLPVGAGENVNLSDVLRWFHQFLADQGPKIQARSELVEKREQVELATLEQKLRNLEIEFERKAGTVISAEEMDRVFTWYEGELRKLGERLGKRFGPEAQNLFNATLDRMQKLLVEE